MAQAYKVGEATYKGPLSVRSDVPQEDGITFIQTDAGDNNDLFAIQHYNGGWSEQGLDLPSVNTEEQSNVYTRIFDSSDDPSAVKEAIESASRGDSFKFGSGEHYLSSVTPVTVPDGVKIEGQEAGLEVSDDTLWADEDSNTVTSQGTVLVGDTSTDCFIADSLDSFAFDTLAFRDWNKPINLGSGQGMVQFGTLDNLYFENTADSAIHLNNILYLTGRHWQATDVHRLVDVELSHNSLNMGNSVFYNWYTDLQNRTGATDGVAKFHTTGDSNVLNMFNIYRFQARDYDNTESLINYDINVTNNTFADLNPESDFSWEIKGAGNFSNNFVRGQFPGINWSTTKGWNNFFYIPDSSNPYVEITNSGSRNWFICGSWDPSNFTGEARQFVWADGGLYDGKNKLWDLDGWRTYVPLSSAPSAPSTGQTALADGANWDPDGDGAAELVQYANGSWSEILDHGTTY